ncbi:hypothetical protein CNO08_05925 [Lysobacter capsici]|nr:hypothetical protein CNO08_05925 [Lysobacter capsici]
MVVARLLTDVPWSDLGIGESGDSIGKNMQMNLKVGDLYEDVFFHPCLCVGIDDEGGFAWGISLIDGSYPRTTDLYMSGIRRLTPEQAWANKMLGPEKCAEQWNAEHPEED